MKFKLLFITFLMLGFYTTAQVKVGNNPTTIATDANLQVEGTTTSKQFVILSNGSVGVGTTTPKVALDVKGEPTVTTAVDGIMPPRLTREQLTAKTGYGVQQTGTVVYITSVTAGTTNTATADIKEKGYYYFDGSVWAKLNMRADIISNVYTEIENNYDPGQLLYLIPGKVANGPWYAKPLNLITNEEAMESPIVGYVNKTVNTMSRFNFIRFDSDATVIGVDVAFAAEKAVWYRPFETIKWADNPGDKGNAVRIGYTYDAAGTSTGMRIRFNPEWAAATIYQKETAYKPVISNIIANSASVTKIGRYLVPASGVSGGFVGQENKYADYNGSTFVYSNPTNGDFAQIVEGANIGIIYLYNGTSWVQNSKTTPIATDNYNVQNDYKKNDLIIRNNKVFQANNNIPANTAFAIGTTGATWKKISHIPEWELSGVYETGDIAKKDGILIEANGNIPANTAFTIGTTGATWKSFTGTAEYGNIELGNTISVPAGIETDIVSFTLPSAGIWEVTYQPCVEGAFGVTNNLIRAWLTDNSNNIIANSSQRINFSSNSSVSSSASYTVRITTAGSETFKLRGASSAMSVWYAGAISGTDFNTNVIWRKISGFLPVETTGTISPSWNINNTYPLAALVVNQNALYQANGYIVAGTPFTVGTTGATWKLINYSDKTSGTTSATGQEIITSVDGALSIRASNTSGRLEARSNVGGIWSGGYTGTWATGSAIDGSVTLQSSNISSWTVAVGGSWLQYGGIQTLVLRNETSWRVYRVTRVVSSSYLNCPVIIELLN